VTAQSSDESGTLVTVARTADSVIISVDSMITHYELGVGFDVPKCFTDGTHKLVNVGERSACAIDVSLAIEM
jgi:hypothetical protein